MRAKRNKTKNRIRKSTKYIYILIAIVLIVVSSYDFLRRFGTDLNLKTTSKQIYSYTNKFNYNYDVNLVENKYTKGMNLSDKSLAYITDLINDIDLNINYEYTADKRSDLTYEYEIIGRMQAVYTKDGEEQKVIERDDTLLEKTIIDEKTSKINITENLKLDLKEKNNLLLDLKQQTGMSLKAVYSVFLKINVKTIIEDEEVNMDYKPVVTIDLAEKTTQVKGENNKEDTQYIAKQVPKDSKISYTFIFDMIGMLVGIFLLRYASTARVTNRIRNEYRYELNRLLKLCEDKIVRVNDRPDINDENTVTVRDFGEIVKLSEELFKPILCFIDDEDDEAWFTVMSNNVNYRYILRK